MMVTVAWWWWLYHTLGSSVYSSSSSSSFHMNVVGVVGGIWICWIYDCGRCRLESIVFFLVSHVLMCEDEGESEKYFWLSCVFCVFLPTTNNTTDDTMTLKFVFFCFSWSNKLTEHKQECVTLVECSSVIFLSFLLEGEIWNNNFL